jgi:hypothetical protein
MLVRQSGLGAAGFDIFFFFFFNILAFGEKCLVSKWPLPIVGSA